jgi:hypothetical protein
MEDDIVQDATLLEDARALIRQLWGVRPTMRHLPCCNPSSIMLADLHQLSRQPYWVGPKTDGVRRFVLLGRMESGTMEQYALTVDRSYVMRRVRLETPLDASFYQGTLLDAELVRPAGPGDPPTLVLFDTVAYKGYRYTGQKHTRRVRPLREFADQARLAGVRLRVKDWVPLRDSVELWNRLRRASDLPTDGLILCPQFGFLKPGRHRTMYKWKPASHHTIDFILTRRKRATEDTPPTLLLSDRGRMVPATSVFPDITLDTDDEAGRAAASQIPCVVEGLLHPETSRLRVVRVRRDKLTANDVSVARLTRQNQVEGIRVENLARYAAARPTFSVPNEQSETTT